MVRAGSALAEHLIPGLRGWRPAHSSLRLDDVRITPELVSAHERMLTGGFYAEIKLAYDATVVHEEGGKPFGFASLPPIQLSRRRLLEDSARGREAFTAGQ